MAKLGSYYGLCPLIDQRSLLGISQDVKPGHVIVTLGKNLAIKYKLSNQKQVHSWRTKDKFSSPVLYNDEENKYTAIFNQSYIRMWDEDEENLDKQKKYKLQQPMHTLLKCNGVVFVIFENGAALHLNSAIADRKTLNPETVIDTESEYISDIIHTIIEDEIYIALMVNKKENIDDRTIVWSVYEKNGKKKEINMVPMNRKDKNLVGYCFEKATDKYNLNLFTLWSDGKLYSYPIHNENTMSIIQESTIQPPGNMTAIIQSLSCKHLVTMTALNEHYIAMYGADTSEEGATLNIYNLQFKVTQTRQPFKMFNNGTRLWQIDDNILLCVGQNLAVVPFHLETEQLAALIGSHKPKARSEQDPDITIVQTMQSVVWDQQLKEEKENMPENLKKMVDDLLEQGLSFNAVCEDLIEQLIEKVDLYGISEAIAYFDKMPERCIVKLIKFILGLDSSKFQQVPTQEEVPETLQPYQRCCYLDSLLTLPYTDSFLIQQVRKQLDINDCLLLLKYVVYMLQEDSHSLPFEDEIASERKLIEWGNILLDANYVKFLLVKDENVLEVLKQFVSLAKQHLESLQSVNSALPLVTAMNNGRYNMNIQNARLPYSIETIKLY